MNRLGAVADEAGEVMDVKGVTGLGDEPDPRAQPGANQFLAYRPDREQHRDRRPGGPGGAIAHDQQLGAGAHGVHRLAGERCERRTEGFDPVGRIPDRIDDLGGEAADVEQPGHLGGQQRRMLHAQHAGRIRALHQRRPAPPEMHAQ